MSNPTISSQKQFVFGLAISAALLASSVGNVYGQSGSRSYNNRGASSQATSGKLALEGYCPVCIVKMNKWVKGSPEYQTTYDGKTYYFPGDQQRQMFLANPAQFVPALGGDCTVCFAKMGKRMPGNIRYAAIFGKRLYLFPNDSMKQMFLAQPNTFQNVDLALGGKCPVCLATMKKEVVGKPEFTVVYQGLRYLFPSSKQRDMFLKNPAEFVAQAVKTSQTSSTAVQPRLVTVRGTSACAGCEHGIVPLGAPETLGLAVDATDGHVFVIENAHKLYPEVYKNRYDGLNIEVTGEIVKQDGVVAWIQPSALRVLN